MSTSVTDLLRAEGLITPDQLLAAQSMARTMGESVLSILVEQGAVAKRDVVRCTVQAAGLTFVDVLDVDVDPAAVALLTGDQARLYQVLPYALDGDDLMVVSDAQTAANRQVAQDLRAITRHAVRFACTVKSELQQRMSLEYPVEIDPEPMGEDDSVVLVLDALDPAAAAPAREYVDELLREVVARGASGVHLLAAGPQTRVRARVDGVLTDARKVPRAVQPAVVYRLKKLSGLDPADRSRPQHGVLRYRADSTAITMRVSTVPTIDGEEIVFQVAPPDPEPRHLDELGFDDAALATWRSVIDRRDGLVVVTGPAASGRSTLLQATLSELSHRDMSIVTVESRVESRLPGVTQVQIDERAGYGYPDALDSIRAADPDVIMVGEVNDYPTIRMTVDLALTRALVFTTLPTTDTTDVIGRLVGMGIEPFLVRAVLACVVSQRLVRRLCRDCKRPVDAPVGPPRGDAVPTWARASCFEPIGCSRCGHTGYHGRMALHELLLMTPQLGDLVMRSAGPDEIRVVARQAGMSTLREDGWAKVGQGLTSVEEVLRAVG